MREALGGHRVIISRGKLRIVKRPANLVARTLCSWQDAVNLTISSIKAISSFFPPAFGKFMSQTNGGRCFQSRGDRKSKRETEHSGACGSIFRRCFVAITGLPLEFTD